MRSYMWSNIWSFEKSNFFYLRQGKKVFCKKKVAFFKLPKFPSTLGNKQRGHEIWKFSGKCKVLVPNLSFWFQYELQSFWDQIYCSTARILRLFILLDQKKSAKPSVECRLFDELKKLQHRSKQSNKTLRCELLIFSSLSKLPGWFFKNPHSILEKQQFPTPRNVFEERSFSFEKQHTNFSFFYSMSQLLSFDEARDHSCSKNKKKFMRGNKDKLVCEKKTQKNSNHK